MSETNRVIAAVAQGDLSQRSAVDIDGRLLRGDFLRSARVINTMVDQLNAFASEGTRVAREVGSEGKLGGQASVKGVAGMWKDLTDSVNTMAGNLTAQVRNIADVTTAVAKGDLSRNITVEAKGEVLPLKNRIKPMVDQLSGFAAEVTRVAREVGTEGILGGQADVKGVSGTWKDLTDSVNSMAANLTGQVRGIAKVVTAVANGDLKRKLILDAKGEIAELSDTINGMIDTLAIFADQVTSVAREVGFEGKLGGQAEVPGAAGLWRDLTDSVNQLAAQLTSQIRAIGEVATAVNNAAAYLNPDVSAFPGHLSDYAPAGATGSPTAASGGETAAAARSSGSASTWSRGASRSLRSAGPSLAWMAARTMRCRGCGSSERSPVPIAARAWTMWWRHPAVPPDAARCYPACAVRARAPSSASPAANRSSSPAAAGRQAAGRGCRRSKTNWTRLQSPSCGT